MMAPRANEANAKVESALVQLDEAAKAVATERQRSDNLEARLVSLESQQQLGKRRALQEAFGKSRNVELAVYGVVLLPIAFLLYCLADMSGKLENWWWWGGLFAFLVLSLVQFAKFPDVLFGRFARWVRVKSFRRRLRKLGLSEFENASIDWAKQEVVVPPTLPPIVETALIEAG